jgi:hypothetical protein
MAGGWRIGVQEGKNVNNPYIEGLKGERRDMELIIKHLCRIYVFYYYVGNMYVSIRQRKYETRYALLATVQV